MYGWSYPWEPTDLDDLVEFIKDSGEPQPLRS